MGLPSFESNWSEVIAEVAEQYMNCVIDVLNPNTENVSEYDPEANTGGVATPVKVYSSIQARVQHIRAPYNVPSAVDWNTYRHYRFQVKLSDAPGLVPKGFQIKVLSGGNDPALIGKTFSIEASTNSSHAAVRTFETTTSNVPA